jgi:DNA-binding NarL/FixJ family response regulator
MARIRHSAICVDTPKVLIGRGPGTGSETGRRVVQPRPEARIGPLESMGLGGADVVLMNIAVLLADDHQILVQGLSSLLGRQPDVDVIGTAEDGRGAVELADRLAPDVVIMDVSMPRMSGPEAAKQILAKRDETKILALSVLGEQELVEAMVATGASGYVLKEWPFRALVEAIRAVFSGRPWPGQGAKGALTGEAIRRSRDHDSGAPSTLSDREREVLRLVADGRRSAKIASLLGLSPHTIVRHRQNIMDKLGIHSVAGLTRFAILEHITTL